MKKNLGGVSSRQQGRIDPGVGSSGRDGRCRVELPHVIQKHEKNNGTRRTLGECVEALDQTQPALRSSLSHQRPHIELGVYMRNSGRQFKARVGPRTHVEGVERRQPAHRPCRADQVPITRKKGKRIIGIRKLFPSRKKIEVHRRNSCTTLDLLTEVSAEIVRLNKLSFSSSSGRVETGVETGEAEYAVPQRSEERRVGKE